MAQSTITVKKTEPDTMVNSCQCPPIMSDTASLSGSIGTIKATVKKKGTEDILPYALVVLYSSTSKLAIECSRTDYDGVTAFNGIPPGQYDIKACSSDIKSVQVNGVVVKGNLIQFVTIELPSAEEETKRKKKKNRK